MGREQNHLAVRRKIEYLILGYPWVCKYVYIIIIMYIHVSNTINIIIMVRFLSFSLSQKYLQNLSSDVAVGLSAEGTWFANFTTQSSENIVEQIYLLIHQIFLFTYSAENCELKGNFPTILEWFLDIIHEIGVSVYQHFCYLGKIRELSQMSHMHVSICICIIRRIIWNMFQKTSRIYILCRGDSCTLTTMYLDVFGITRECAAA